MRDCRSGTPSRSRRAASLARSSPINGSRGSASCGGLSLVRDSGDMTYHPARALVSLSYHAVGAPCQGQCRSWQGLSLVAVAVVVAAHHFVGGGQHPDSGVVLAVEQELLERGLELGEVDGGRVVVLGVVAFQPE